MKNSITSVSQSLAGLSGWLMVGIMLLLIADILFRTVGIAIQGLSDLSVFVMIIVVYFGLARCEEYEEHVSLELVTNKLPYRSRLFTQVIAQSLAVVTIGFLLYAVSSNSLDSYMSNESVEGVMQFKIWPVKALMLVGLAAFMLQA
ncbi:TRAP transporter small permease subunit [Vibrio nitrifigilis]|uniref:TRAP transporter small permease protein n=1 Tax=Vibrio nitrifigilis TaxID=2789781 RepID=A0ABS0GIB4_9VIBR|nr:TRAP transporter small permease [Vibrio nitrifigilis]MBF9002174.1 TRAP transporter small permease [Vibrio nitrifigilis]